MRLHGKSATPPREARPKGLGITALVRASPCHRRPEGERHGDEASQMSLLLAGAVGVCRDLAAPAERITVKAGNDSTAPATFGQLVVAQIPAEALLAYTSLLALFSASTDGYQPG